MKKFTKIESGLPITFTKDEYRMLTQLVYQQLFMMESLVEPQTSKMFERISLLSSKLIRHATDFACNDLIARDVVDNAVFPSSTFLDSIMESIAEYDEVSFWEELTHKLAERDLLREVNNEELELMSEEDYLDRLGEKLVFYTNRFSQDGVENLRLD